MSPLERQLRAGRERIANGWTKGKSARTVDGTSVSPASDSAARFCAVGALDRTSSHDNDGMAAIVALAAALPGPPARFAVTRLTQFNDDPDTTKADVLALYDRAIEKGGVVRDPRG